VSEGAKVCVCVFKGLWHASPVLRAQSFQVRLRNRREMMKKGRSKWKVLVFI